MYNLLIFTILGKIFPAIKVKKNFSKFSYSK